MTSIVDSTAHFVQRMKDVNMSDGGQRAVLASGFNTLGKLAFGHGQPGAPIEQGGFDRFAQATLGALATLADQSTLKRLLFESHTLLLSQLKETISNPEAAATRRVPQVERDAKMTAVRRELAGVVIEGPLEPSHHLLDLVSQQFETKQLQYLDPSKCSSRNFEIQMGKTVKQVHLDSEKLVVKEQSQVPAQQGLNELQTYEALRRRGIAYEFADMISWNTHERYLTKLFSHLRKEAPQHYVSPTLQQVLKADRAAFTKLIEDNTPIRRDVGLLRPLDAALEAALASYEVTFNLIPLPKIHTPGPKGDGDKWRPSPYYNSDGDRKGHGKGKKGKRKKGKNKSEMLPKAFWGRDCVSMDPHHRRLCFNYSLGRCDRAADGGSCDSGFHLCMRRGCHAPHPECKHDEQTKGK